MGLLPSSGSSEASCAGAALPVLVGAAAALLPLPPKLLRARDSRLGGRLAGSVFL